MLSVLPEVRVSLESLKDSVLDIYKKNPTEGTEKSDVSEDGIPLELEPPSPEPVN